MSKTVYEGICRYCGIKEIIAENIAHIRRKLRKLEDITPSDLLEFCRNFGMVSKALVKDILDLIRSPRPQQKYLLYKFMRLEELEKLLR
ncbi:MAG: hypothetical protein J7L39_03045, partial [Candidatus Aenigmarchaeota archaeon]|nr:hypothetical protein [Candidatus Aenigmarchaeota archaeon]